MAKPKSSYGKATSTRVIALIKRVKKLAVSVIELGSTKEVLLSISFFMRIAVRI
jgi:hypothetical protein